MMNASKALWNAKLMNAAGLRAMIRQARWLVPSVVALAGPRDWNRNVTSLDVIDVVPLYDAVGWDHIDDTPPRLVSHVRRIASEYGTLINTECACMFTDDVCDTCLSEMEREANAEAEADDIARNDHEQGQIQARKDGDL